MSKGDVSFTFIDRVREIELNVADGRWQSALALALTVPDICGGIAFPELILRYPGGRIRLDKQKNPSRDVGKQYISWFDKYAAPFFKLNEKDVEPYICGERCWQLRCEYLHQNKGFINEETDDAIRFHLGVNCGTSVCKTFGNAIGNTENDVRIDIREFCRRMCIAAQSYYEQFKDKEEFSLYNTPVLDFIQFTRSEQRKSGVIAIMCTDKLYAKGLKQLAAEFSGEVYIFDNPEKVKKHFGKAKPALWIVTGDMTQKPSQPWRSDRTTPVILLQNSDETPTEKETGRLAILKLPVNAEKLKNTIKEYL